MIMKMLGKCELRGKLKGEHGLEQMMEMGK